MTEDSLNLRVPSPLRERLETLAARTGRTVEETLLAALEESVDRWEDHLRACEAMESGSEPRALLHVVNE